MNKIQKILWSIFSGMICMAYKPSYGADATIQTYWRLVSSVEVDTCGEHSTLKSAILEECRTKNGIKASDNKYVGSACLNVFLNKSTNDLTIKSYMSDIYISEKHNIITYNQTSKNICDNKYEFYPNDPTDNPSSSNCIECPIINGVSLDDIYVNDNGYAGKPYYDGTSVTDEVYVNICSAQAPNGHNFGKYYFQVYVSRNSTYTKSTKTQTARDCYIKPKNPYSDDTGTYSYKDTACEYTE